jgi:hypothetical protein
VGQKPLLTSWLWVTKDTETCTDNGATDGGSILKVSWRKKDGEDEMQRVKAMRKQARVRTIRGALAPNGLVDVSKSEQH